MDYREYRAFMDFRAIARALKLPHNKLYHIGSTPFYVSNAFALSKIGWELEDAE